MIKQKSPIPRLVSVNIGEGVYEDKEGSFEDSDLELVKLGYEGPRGKRWVGASYQYM